MIHQTYTARNPQKTPRGSHEMGPSAAVARFMQQVDTIRTYRGASAALSAFFVPGECWPWTLTLTFELVRDFCTLHLTTMFHHPTFNLSKVIMRTNKPTNIRRWKHPPCFATLHRWVTTLVMWSLKYAKSFGLMVVAWLQAEKQKHSQTDHDTPSVL